jgi:tetratricopeptide (TPR) repeat protein
MRCERVAEEFVAERYLRGELAEAESEAFERHYFECTRCFGDLETLRAIGQALGQRAPGTQPLPATRARWHPWMWAAAAAVVASVGAALYWSLASGTVRPDAAAGELRRGQELPPGTPPAGPAPSSAIASKVEAPAAQTGPTAQSQAALATLTLVQPPPYTPVLLRGARDEATRQFRAAMQHYVQGEFDKAKSGLESAARLDPAAPEVAFFLGVCALLTDQPGLAIQQLRRTIAVGDSPYLEEAHLFLAKALLKEGDFDSAAAELEETIRLRGDREREARHLLERLEELTETPPPGGGSQRGETGKR